MKNTIPEQHVGKKLDYSRILICSNEYTADEAFEVIKRKIEDVNQWHKVADSPSAIFQNMDSQNNTIQRELKEGDYIRIDIPGPGLPSADGFDWVQVDRIISQESALSKQFILTLRPCPDPTHKGSDTAHFFKDLATSSFSAERTGKNILVRYAGRNEVINTENDAIADNFRNFLIGLAAKLGASYPQWKALVDGLVSFDKKPRN